MSVDAQYSIWIDPDNLGAAEGSGATPEAKSYVRRVRDVIAAVDKSAVGRALLGHAASYGKAIRISPSGDLQSSAAAQGEARDLTFNKHILPVLNAISPAPFKAIRAIIRFNPEFCANGGDCRKDFVKRNDYIPTPESVLVHELVHTNLQLSKNPLGRLPKLGKGWDSGEGEEFLSVLVEDIFRSETGTSLRARHNGWRHLEQELADSFRFFTVSQKAFMVVDRFCKDEPKLSRSLAAVKASFNPLTAYYKDPAMAKSMSESPYAASRDR